jgi:hypothetical protein
MTRLKAILTVLLFFAALVPCAADVTLDGPSEVKAGATFDLAVRGLHIELRDMQDNVAPQLQWLVVPAASASLRSRYEAQIVIDQETGKARWVIAPYATVTARAAGKFALVLCIVQKCVLSTVSHEVTVTGPGPNPDPDPDPDPDPTPVPPVNEKVWGSILFYESSAAKPDLAELKTNAAVREWIEKQKIHFMVLDPDQKADGDSGSGIIKDWLPIAKKLGNNTMPYLLIVGDKGSVLWHGKPPNSVEFLKVIMALINGHAKPVPRKAA